MATKLSQRILDSSEKQIQEHYKGDLIAKGLTTTCVEMSKDISERLLNVSAQMVPHFVEMFNKAATKTRLAEEKQYLISYGKLNDQVMDIFLDVSMKTFGTVPQKVMSTSKPKFIEEYDRHLIESLNSGLIEGSIIPFLVSILPAIALWFDLVHRLKENPNPLLTKLIPLMAILTSDNQLEKIKAFIDRMDNQITLEVEDKLKAIFEKSLIYEKQFYAFVYSGHIEG